MAIPMRILFRDKAPIFLEFKSKAYGLTTEEFGAVYEEVASVDLQGETDLNQACADEIIKSLLGKKALEVGCGRGYLAGRVAKKMATTGCDIVLPADIREQYPDVRFQEADIEALPYKDKSFDTVICTHTLEHVRDLPKAIAELRRVTAKRLIIVVPRQRPYNYNFSLHLNFFSHSWSFPALLGYRPKSKLTYLGDWFYVEDK
jgi:ubiquinone/menaquinone biosynthesis C-methylase UbiE